MPIQRTFIKDPKANYDLPDAQTVRNTLGERLCDLRKKHRQSQIELARTLGKKSAAYIAFIESGERNITAAELARIAHHFKVKTSHFYP